MMTSPQNLDSPLAQSIGQTQVAQWLIPDLSGLPAVAPELAGHWSAGDVIALRGPMGAGKTTLTRALGSVFDLQEEVNSPTFTLVHRYTSGTLPLIHVDLYRLGELESPSDKDLEVLGQSTVGEELLEEIAGQQSLILVEWPEYGTFLTPHWTWEVRIEPQYPDTDALLSLEEPPRLITLFKLQHTQSNNPKQQG